MDGWEKQRNNQQLKSDRNHFVSNPASVMKAKRYRPCSLQGGSLQLWGVSDSALSARRPAGIDFHVAHTDTQCPDTLTCGTAQVSPHTEACPPFPALTSTPQLCRPAPGLPFSLAIQMGLHTR